MKRIIKGYIFKVCPYSWGTSSEAFSRPCLNTSNHVFKKTGKMHKAKNWEVKLSDNEASAYDHIIVGAEKINLNKRHTSHLYMWKMHSHYLLYDSQKHCAIRKIWWYAEFHSRKISGANYKTRPRNMPQ